MLGLQFYGALLVDENRDTYEIRLEEIPQETIHLFASAHQSLIELNQACLVPIINEISEAYLSVDPYSEYTLKRPLAIGEERLIERDELHALSRIFHQHPSIAIAVESFKRGKETIDAAHFFQDVMRYQDQLTERGPLHEPDWIDAYKSSLRSGLEQTHTRLMLSLLCVRESLRNMNQLIFQSAIFDKLIKLDSSNVIDLSPTFSNGSGFGLGVVFYNGNFDFLMASTFNSLNRILLIDGAYGMNGNCLARYEAYRGSLGVSHGANYTELRLIDDNLNPYPNFAE